LAEGQADNRYRPGPTEREPTLPLQLNAFVPDRPFRVQILPIAIRSGQCRDLRLALVSRTQPRPVTTGRTKKLTLTVALRTNVTRSAIGRVHRAPLRFACSARTHRSCSRRPLSTNLAGDTFSWRAGCLGEGNSRPQPELA
jgi:hypothetical protein